MNEWRGGRNGIATSLGIAISPLVSRFITIITGGVSIDNGGDIHGDNYDDNHHDGEG